MFQFTMPQHAAARIWIVNYEELLVIQCRASDKCLFMSVKGGLKEIKLLFCGMHALALIRNNLRPRSSLWINLNVTII